MRARSFSLLALTLVLTATTLFVAANDDKNKCNLRKSSVYERTLYEILNNFVGLELAIQDEHHDYYLTICQKDRHGIKESDAFIQVNRATNATVVIGRLDDVDLEGTTNMLRLNYKNGDKYPNACNKANRSSVIYFECPKDKKSETFDMIEENNERGDNCNYVFVINIIKMCNFSAGDVLASSNITTTPAPTTSITSSTTSTTAATVTTTTTTTKTTTTQNSTANNSTTQSPNGTTDNSSQTTKPTDKKEVKKLGLFSIVFIIAISFGLVYMVLGTLYLRFVRKARGWEQIPNWPVWQAIGHKSADCCNQICRCGQRQSEVHSYENINSRESDDENLLNM